jgi:hypothetical protein
MRIVSKMLNPVPTGTETLSPTATIREWATITKTLTWTAVANIWVTKTATLTALERSRTTSTITRTVETNVWATKTANWTATSYVCTTTTSTWTINNWATAMNTLTVTDTASAVTKTVTPTITITVPATTVTSLACGTATYAKKGLDCVLSLVRVGDQSVAMLVVAFIIFVLVLAVFSLGYHLCGGCQARGTLGAPILDDVTAACEKSVGVTKELEVEDSDDDQKRRPAVAK